LTDLHYSDLEGKKTNRGGGDLQHKPERKRTQRFGMKGEKGAWYKQTGESLKQDMGAPAFYEITEKKAKKGDGLVTLLPKEGLTSRKKKKKGEMG